MPFFIQILFQRVFKCFRKKLCEFSGGNDQWNHELFFNDNNLYLYFKYTLFDSILSFNKLLLSILQIIWKMYSTINTSQTKRDQLRHKVEHKRNNNRSEENKREQLEFLKKTLFAAFRVGDNFFWIFRVFRIF